MDKEIDNMKKKIKEITITARNISQETQEKIFYAIQKEDFRPCSCGGCI